MTYQFFPYLWFLIASTFTLLALGLYALVRREKAKGATSFTLSMLILFIWTSANALEMASVDFATKLFWANVQYFAYCYSPVSLLALCMEFTEYDQWIRNKKVLWLTIIPTVIIILVWTDGLHGLIRYDMHMDYSGAFPVINKKYGPIFFIHATYSHLLNTVAWILLVKAVFLRNTIYRKQALSLFIALTLIMLPNILYILGVSPVKKYDITPVFFGPSGLIAAWGIFRYKLFDVIPVAWAAIIRNMDERVIVMDLKDRIIEMNPSFEKMIGYTASAVSAKAVEDVCSHIPGLKSACLDKMNTHREFSINKDGALRYYEALLSPLKNDKNILIGRLAVIHDITKKKQEQQAYLRHQWKQAVTMEKERHARDMHDNLGQVLGFIGLQAQGIKQELVNSGIDLVSKELDKLIAVAQTSNNEVREYIRKARNEKVGDEDFFSALKQCIDSFEERTGIETKLLISSRSSWEQMAPDVKVHILNIVKEAMNNISKHAEAQNASVSFSLVQGQFCAVVEDDGKGFDVKQCVNGTGTRYGLSIMRERAQKIGAQMEIESSAQNGSRIALFIPIKEGGEDAENNYAG